MHVAGIDFPEELCKNLIIKKNVKTLIGSFKIFKNLHEIEFPKRVRRRIAYYKYTDKDGLPVKVSLYVDRNDQPVEVDIFKAGSKPVFIFRSSRAATKALKIR